MAYGVKRGIKSPGNFTMVDIVGLGLAGSAGIIAALVTDYQQSGEASALFTINQWAVALGSILGFTNIPLWMVVIGMTAVGAASVFYFQPTTRQGAFAQGFGLLAVLMTAIPSDLAGGIEGINGALPGLEPISTREASVDGQVYRASYTAEAVYTPVQDQRGQAKYDVQLTINFPEGLPESVDSMIRKGSFRGRLHNEDTKETWNLARTAGGTLRQQGDSLIIRAGVPARSQTARLWVRVEAQGYEIQITSYEATTGGTIDWVVNMAPSDTPLFIQRLNQSFWF